MKFVNRFIRREDGTATVEAVLWIPFFVGFFILLADAAIIFMNQSMAMRVTQDGMRALSVGQFDNCAELTSWLETRLAVMSPSVDASCDDSDIFSVVTVTMPSGELDLSGATGLISDFEVRVLAQYFVE